MDPVEYTLFVRDTQDLALLRRGIWLTLRCGDDYPRYRWKLRDTTANVKMEGEAVVLRYLNSLGLEGECGSEYVGECYPQIMCSVSVTRLKLQGVRHTFASWLTFGRHGMWVTSKPRDGPNKYAACMRDCWPRSYAAAFSRELQATHDFSSLIRDPHHPLCQYHRLVTLEMAIAEHSDSVEGSSDDKP